MMETLHIAGRMYYLIKGSLPMPEEMLRLVVRLNYERITVCCKLLLKKLPVNRITR